MSVIDDIRAFLVVKKEIKCQICNRTFKRGKDLKSHSVIHLDAKPFVCNQCPEAFKHKTSLKRHSLIHSGEKPFTCRICGKSFRQKGSLNEHSLTHSGVKPHACEVCNMGFTTKSNYNRHLKKHLLSKPFTCNVCNEGFSVRSYLTRHCIRHQEVDKTINSLKLESVHEFSSAEDDDLHVDEPPSHCQPRDEMVSSTSNISFIAEEAEIIDDELKHMCRMCNKSFKRYSNLRMHIMTHVNKKLYICEICKCSFTSMGAFCKHKLTHNQETSTHKNGDKETENSLKEILDKRYICTVCNRTFLREFQFMHHSITHKYPGPYNCDICGESSQFEKLQELHKHYEEHGEVACLCYNCTEESGIDDSNVNYSKSTYSKCEICHKGFPHKFLLRKHFPTHKNKRPLLVKLNT